MQVDPLAESPAMVPRLVTARDLSQILAVSESTIYSMAAAGEIPCIRVGRRSVRFRLGDVMAALERVAS